MQQRHYDIIILGDSLAARLAGALLAKTGKRLLTFGNSAPQSTAWLYNSIFLSHTLDQLGGRKGLSDTPRMQIMDGQTRLELHGRHSLEDELRREFPSCHQQLSRLLESLKSQGSTLEQQLWDGGGLPVFDFSGRLQFRKQLFLNRTPYRPLRHPLYHAWRGIQDPAARTWLTTLFTGLSLQPAERLTLAEGALLWNDLRQPLGIGASALNDLLAQRYGQFHGLMEPLTAVESVNLDGNIQLKKGRSCSADILLLGDMSALPLFADMDKKRVKGMPAPRRWKTSALRNPPSPLLAPQIILGGNPVLRLTLNPPPSGALCSAEAQDPDQERPNGQTEIRSRLTALFPFSSIEVTELPSKTIQQGNQIPWATVGTFPGKHQNLKLQKNLYICSGTEALPHLETSREILCGVAVAKYLLGKD